MSRREVEISLWPKSLACQSPSFGSNVLFQLMDAQRIIDDASDVGVATNVFGLIAIDDAAAVAELLVRDGTASFRVLCGTKTAARLPGSHAADRPTRRSGCQGGAFATS